MFGIEGTGSGTETHVRKDGIDHALGEESTIILASITKWVVL